MQIFITWSGEPSKAVATKLRDFLKGVIQCLRPWVSSVDIPSGARWENDIRRKLDECAFGIACVTRDNPQAPWMLFEVGAIAKKVERAFVCPYLIGMEEGNLPSGPLVTFQAKRATEEGTWDLLTTINDMLAPESRLQEELLKKQFTLYWPDLCTTIELATRDVNAPSVRRSVDDVVAEILEIVRRWDSAPKWFIDQKNLRNFLTHSQPYCTSSSIQIKDPTYLQALMEVLAHLPQRERESDDIDPLPPSKPK